MSCPDWPLLAERRDEDPGAWERAVVHSDRCRECREAALEVDPLLLFRNLPAPGLDRAEIDEIHRGVATLRRARSLEVDEPETGRQFPWAAAAAAVLALLLTGAPAHDGPEIPPEAPTGTAETLPAATAGPKVLGRGLPGTLISASVLAELPVVEDLETAGPLMQVDGRDLTVVMVQRKTSLGDV